jgi:hypothetical protein
MTENSNASAVRPPPQFRWKPYSWTIGITFAVLLIFFLATFFLAGSRINQPAGEVIAIVLSASVVGAIFYGSIIYFVAS